MPVVSSEQISEFFSYFPSCKRTSGLWRIRGMLLTADRKTVTDTNVVGGTDRVVNCSHWLPRESPDDVTTQRTCLCNGAVWKRNSVVGGTNTYLPICLQHRINLFLAELLWKNYLFSFLTFVYGPRTSRQQVTSKSTWVSMYIST